MILYFFMPTCCTSFIIVKMLTLVQERVMNMVEIKTRWNRLNPRGAHITEQTVTLVSVKCLVTYYIQSWKWIWLLYISLYWSCSSAPYKAFIPLTLCPHHCSLPPSHNCFFFFPPLSPPSLLSPNLSLSLFLWWNPLVIIVGSLVWGLFKDLLHQLL